MTKKAENGIKNLTQIYLTAYQEALRVTGSPMTADDAASAVLMTLSAQSAVDNKNGQKVSTPEDIIQAFLAGMYAGQAAGMNEGEDDEEP